MQHPHTRASLLTYLEAEGIKAETFDHPPIFTVADGEEHWRGIPGTHCKNLFLKDAKEQMWLVSCPIARKVDLKSLPDRIGSARLSFGSADRLRATLFIEPGSVTPFALINDRAKNVICVLDKAMMGDAQLVFHPLENTASTLISPEGLVTFLKSISHAPRLVTL
ncbi:MAG: prolyl-tRNA synthetase associated domain-containing protein [Alphaproteobacteria bacterium]|nr:prolyl-tRNA synthetase associated domain-containing protein [Alphaproteobacteria bacterium]